MHRSDSRRRESNARRASSSAPSRRPVSGPPKGARRKRGGETILVIAILSMVPQFASDLYMPGLPTITEQLRTTQALTSHTMTVFFFFMALGTLTLGPLSDKYGRQPVLAACAVAACGSCLACAFVPSIGPLLALRALQGLGSGGMVAVSTAVAKDCFEGPDLSKALGVAQAVSMIAPVASPLLGVVLLELFGWRSAFVFLAALLALTLAIALRVGETLPASERVKGSALSAFAGVAQLLRDRSFMLTLLAMGVFMAPFMAYLSVASYAYIDFFGLDEVAFSVIFAISALASIAGPLFSARKSDALGARAVMNGCLIATAGVLLLLLALGKASPFVFMAAIMAFLFCATVVRPMFTGVLLAPLNEGAGAASSLINFACTLLGCLGMVVGSAGWADVVVGLEVVLGGSLAISVIAWLLSGRARR